METLEHTPDPYVDDKHRKTYENLNQALDAYIEAKKEAPSGLAPSDAYAAIVGAWAIAEAGKMPEPHTIGDLVALQRLSDIVTNNIRSNQ